MRRQLLTFYKVAKQRDNAPLRKITLQEKELLQLCCYNLVTRFLFFSPPVTFHARNGIQIWERDHTPPLYFGFCLDQQGQLTISATTSLRARQINLHNKGEVGHLTCFLYILFFVFRAVFKRFGFSILRPKPKVIILLIRQFAQDKHNPVNQSKLQASTRSGRHEVREQREMIGFGFTSD